MNRVGTLEFVKQSDGSSPKATLDLSSVAKDSNVAYKIKTTAPKLFVVKPIQGIIAPGRTIQVEIKLQLEELANFADIFKNKFMVQATQTELQSSETFKLTKFWEEKTALKDKSSI